MKIRLAQMTDFDVIVRLIDGEFTKEGFGFVNREQIRTEIRKRRVLVAENIEIIGVRLGLGVLWNIVIAKSERGQGVGTALVEYHRPHTIRVKCEPVGHLSKKQKEEFTDPTPFYESLGYKYWGNSFPRNFWQRAGEKAIFHAKGEKAHIKIYKDPNLILLPVSTSKGE